MTAAELLHVLTTMPLGWQVRIGSETDPDTGHSVLAATLWIRDDRDRSYEGLVSGVTALSLTTFRELLGGMIRCELERSKVVTMKREDP